MEVRPFTIHVPDDVLDDLRWRLGQTRFPDAIPGSGWDYGSNLESSKTWSTTGARTSISAPRRPNSIAGTITRPWWMV
jgi:Epoxide hydrolase N terminus